MMQIGFTVSSTVDLMVHLTLDSGADTRDNTVTNS